MPAKQHRPHLKERRGTSHARGYTKRWERFRDSFLRQHPLCAYCLADGHTKAATVCDHDLPHEQDPALFWDNTFTALCASHHSGEKQRAEAELTGDDLILWVQRRKQPRKVWGFSIPHGLQPSAIPVTIICGPPAAGKSTWARQQARPGDLVIDFDVIRRAVGGSPWDRRPEILRAAFSRRAEILHSLSLRTSGRCWFIVMAPSLAERDTWQAALGPLARLVVLDTAEAVCIERIGRDPDRSSVADEQIELVRAWFGTETAKMLRCR